jgi:hypothetical protein
MTEPVASTLHQHDFDHIASRIDALDRFLNTRIDALDRYHKDLADERNGAVDIALAAANEKFSLHNDLIRKTERDAANYVTKDQAAMQFRGLAVALGALAALFSIYAVIRVLTT